MKKIFFNFPGSDHLAEKLLHHPDFIKGDFVLRQFPDGESYVRVLSPVDQKTCFVLVCFKNPNEQILPLYFLVKNLKNLGAKKIILIAPYLPYMRQDIIFKEGEALTSRFFATFLSGFVDELVTIDPHLHRVKCLSEIYLIPTTVLSAASIIGEWIHQNVKNPFILGPDSESDQWVMQTANKNNIPYIVLSKERLGDKEVLITQTDMTIFSGYQPVLVDDIISTAHTMIETIKNISKTGWGRVLCIGIHAVFAGSAQTELQTANPLDVVTTNTLNHSSNKIDISPLLLSHLKNYVE